MNLAALKGYSPQTGETAKNIYFSGQHSRTWELLFFLSIRAGAKARIGIGRFQALPIKGIGEEITSMIGGN